MKKRFLAPVLLAAMLGLAGCGGGEGIEGTWRVSLGKDIIEGVSVNGSFGVRAEYKFKDGNLSITTRPDIPVAGWFFKVVIDGTYRTDDTGNPQFLYMTRNKVSLKLGLFKVTLDRIISERTYLYKIEGDSLYLLRYDKLGEEERQAYQRQPELIPWDEITGLSAIFEGSMQMERR